MNLAMIHLKSFYKAILALLALAVVQVSSAQDDNGVVCKEYASELYEVARVNQPSPLDIDSIKILSEYISSNKSHSYKCSGYVDKGSLVNLISAQQSAQSALESYQRSITDMPDMKGRFYDRAVGKYNELMSVLKAFNKALKSDAERAGAA